MNQPLFFDHTEFLQGSVFVDRDGKHFRHILNWLRDGVVPTLTDSEYLELLREAEYYQLLVSHFVIFLATTLLLVFVASYMFMKVYVMQVFVVYLNSVMCSQ